ncbi:MAG: nuclear transport factor 2 family protein [Acidimicrobiales bacterium]
MRVAKRRRVGPSDPMAVVTRFLDAANHHDADTLYASVHPEFESFQPLHPGRNFRGPGQLISNWKAIFQAEPGFRLTVLRASTTGNTVWVELHGAGDSAEAAGIFIVGVENGRIRWVRVYSDLVEPADELDEEEPGAQVTADPSATEPAAAQPSGARPGVDGVGDTSADEDGGRDAGVAAASLGAAPSEPTIAVTGEAEAPPQPGLHLVDLTGSPGEHDKPETDTGWVETLVGRSGPVPAITSDTLDKIESSDELEPGGGLEPGGRLESGGELQWVDELKSVEVPGSDDAGPTGDGETGETDETGSGSEPAAPEAPEVPAADDEDEADAPSSESFEFAEADREPVRSRWRKAFKRG